MLYPSLKKEITKDLKYTPSELKTQVFSHFVLCFGFAKTLAEQSATAALMSKLLDASVLDYTPMRCKPTLRSWCYRTTLVKKTSHRGAISCGSLVQAQTRSHFIICTDAHFVSDGAKGANPFFSAEKKNTARP